MADNHTKTDFELASILLEHQTRLSNFVSYNLEELSPKSRQIARLHLNNKKLLEDIENLTQTFETD